MSATTLEIADTEATTRPPTVLTVDDEPSVLSALRRLFHRQGYRMLQANGGAEGLAMLREERVDLVISDMRMPEMDGAQFLEAVRHADPGIVRILMTGYADIGSTIAAINRGEIHRYVAKPWDDQGMLLIVRDALARRDLERQNAHLTALTQRQNAELRHANQTLESRVASRTAELQQVNDMLEKSYDDLNQTFMLSVTVFSGLLEMREGGVAGHARRVARLAQRTAARLGLSEREQTDVNLGALLHDIGKIGFPDRLFEKPHSLYSPQEVSRYRRHPVDGETALMPLTRLQGAARIVRQHHERVDGHGFPDGLTGNQIAVGARIVGLVSDYDSLTGGRLGETPHTPESARQTLRNAIGTHYDARVAEAFFAELDAIRQTESNDVEVDVRDLRAGMVLARDLLSPRGAVLLAAGYVFDERIIRQVSAFATRERARMTLRVRHDSLATAAPAGPVAEVHRPGTPDRTGGGA